MNENTKLTIYTDGSCKPNPGNGGYAAIIKTTDGTETIVAGNQSNTTNNAMEITALLMALRQVRDPAAIDVYTDSLYVANTVKGDWKIEANQALWAQLFAEIKRACVGEPAMHYVPGHKGIPDNERCDKLAEQERMKLETETEPAGNVPDIGDVAKEFGFDDENGEAQEPV